MVEGERQGDKLLQAAEGSITTNDFVLEGIRFNNGDLL